MTKLVFYPLVIALLLFPSALFAEGITVSETPAGGAFPLAANNAAATLVVDNNDADVVKVAAQAFSKDVNLLTGLTPLLRTAPESSTAVIIGTLGKSALIEQLASGGKIDRSRLADKWETFCISVVDNPVSGVAQALVIAGSDPRGTAFGVFELSRMMGVSPWVWWADVTPETRTAIYVSGNNVFGPPSVKYRGLFINDEDWGMQPWSSNKMDADISDIGPRAHEKIFEMLLRTKSNFFWPAMHACTKAFWYIKTNPEVARKYAIVLGASHCEPMLRNNEGEWNKTFATEYPGVTRGDWNWKTNSTVIKNYWIDRVKESKNTEAVYTLGMRGVHDSQMLGYNTDKERAEALKDIVATQRTILETYLEKPQATVPQLFCPYKEALLHYNEGIDLPDDVTLLWPDDNHGFIRQLSTPAEQARSGGGGVYYHFSYLGPPRQSYLWLSSTSPVKISHELSKAYDLNAKNIWVFNVGDIKPAEFEYQFAMDLAWDVNAWRPEKAHEYARKWAEETFGATWADEIAEIQKNHYFLSASGRPELLAYSSFSAPEMEQRIADYTALAEKAKALETQLPERLKASYFQLILYPVQCTAAMNEKILGAKLSYYYAARGETTKALQISDRAHEAYRIIRDMTYTYNKTIAGGKWDGMMSYSPNSLGFFYAPDVVSAETLANTPVPAEPAEQVTSIPAKEYLSKSATVKVIEELGIAGASLTVLPLNMTSYTASNITSAPYAEYQVHLKQGNNVITVKCLPSFPLYPGLDLRYAVSINGATPQFTSIKTIEGQSEWRQSVLRGYAGREISVQSASEKDVNVKVYFADPGLTLSAIDVTVPSAATATAALVNPDFEYDKDGNQLPSGIMRGDPYGWTHTGTLKGNSWGTNQDALNYHGGNVCWYSSSPMPTNFELSQTVKGLPAGEYLLRCLLGVPAGNITTQRLFANKYVQYYGKESDYLSNLTADEKNTFAGYLCDAESSEGTMLGLKEMAVKVILLQGEDLKIGIRSSNKLSSGTTASGSEGWFKVDNFRLELLREINTDVLKTQLADLIREAQDLYNSTQEGTAAGEYPQPARSAFQTAIQAAQTVNQNANATQAQLVAAIEALQNALNTYKKSVNTLTAYIVNASFEYKAEGVLNDGSIVRGTPYGWYDTGEIIGNSFGINNDASNIDGNNVCWYSSSPMPDNFELYQNISGLPTGEYTVRCKMAITNNAVTTQRLFANHSVQYYGFGSEYGANIVSGENYSFAGWTTSSTFNLQEMKVNVVIAEGETLRLGVRTNNKKANGQAATNNSGWFKVDNFRLELKTLQNGSGLDTVKNDYFKIIGEKGACRLIFTQPLSPKSAVQVISLSGNIVYNAAVKSQETRIPLPRGLYIVKTVFDGQTQCSKIVVK
ncbi:MAG: glycosyl hydrolase 115 family protein [Prevotella sp.]|jgi:hypothetical protein|nr:glycosyl hydrolase 115 family protein [Prevotella sp.]